jgi:aerobic-type carbon monoxide dehydrogenase small subunit (CoxS/CutS family)
MARISLKVNGQNRVVDADPETPLLYILRNDLQLNGPKYGCGNAARAPSSSTATLSAPA